MKNFNLQITEEQREILMNMSSSMGARAAMTLEYLEKYVDREVGKASIEEVRRQEMAWNQINKDILLARMV